VESQRTSDPKPPTKARPASEWHGESRWGKDGWFLSMRRGKQLGPFLSANAAMDASRDLATRLRAARAYAGDGVVEAFIQEHSQKLATGASDSLRG
jgi:hypothetical protein